MTVRTTWRFHCPPEAVWPLLCSSRLDGSPDPLFHLGLPQPRECRLPAGEGGAGRERQCISDQGVVHQRILTWEPPRRLSFRMEQTDLPFRKHVAEITETFALAPAGSGTQVTRTTEVQLLGGPVTRIAFYLGLKKIHRYVFSAWARLLHRAEVDTSPAANAQHLNT